MNAMQLHFRWFVREKPVVIKFALTKAEVSVLGVVVKCQPDVLKGSAGSFQLGLHWTNKLARYIQFVTYHTERNNDFKKFKEVKSNTHKAVQ